jgi:polysaccharide chain length determinant protein (PEP-CTERM system associated)
MSRSLGEVVGLAISGAWRRRYLICIPILVMPVLGAAAGLLAPKAFEARMTILVQEPDNLNPILHDLAIGADLRARMPSLQALLNSKHVLVDVLKDLGQLGPRSDPKTIDARVGALSRALTSNLIGAEMIELRIRGREPQGLARTLAAVGSRFMERVLAPGRGSVESSEAFLREQLDRSQSDLDRAEQAFADFKTRNADKLPALYSANVGRLAAMQQNLEEKRIALATADAAFEDLQKRVSTLNPVVGRLEEAIVQTSSELAGLRARYTDEHSEVQAALRKLKRLEEERDSVLASTRHENGADMQRLWNLAAGVATSGDSVSAPLLVGQMKEVQEADTRRTALRTELEQLSAGVEKLRAANAAFAPIERQQQELERAIATARDQHDALARRYEMARLTSSLGRFDEPERVKIIDAPQDPTGPVTPPRILFVIGGLVGGVALGVGLAAVFEVLDPRLRRVQDFEDAAALPVLAVIPRIEQA